MIGWSWLTICGENGAEIWSESDERSGIRPKGSVEVGEESLSGGLPEDASATSLV
jgi:hypothetical protein